MSFEISRLTMVLHSPHLSSLPYIPRTCFDSYELILPSFDIAKLLCLCPRLSTTIPDFCTCLLLIPEILAFTGNPKSILNSMWLNATVHFGLRGRQEHVQMLWGDIELNTDSSGAQYLEFHEITTKTRQGVTRDIRAFSPKMYSTGN